MKIFLRELTNNKLTKNYVIIFLSIIVILNIANTSIIYGKKVLNENYNGSYIYIKTKNTKEINLINNYKYINEMIPCFLEDNNIFILSNNKILTTYNENIKYKSNNQSKNSKNSEYIILLSEWNNYNDFLDLLNQYEIDYDFSIFKKNELPFENYYKIFEIVIKIIIFIDFIIYIITAINFCIDQYKYNRLYYYLGYSLKKIKSINRYKIYIVLSFVFIISIVLQFLIMFILKIKDYMFLRYYIFYLLSMLIINYISTKWKRGNILK